MLVELCSFDGVVIFHVTGEVTVVADVVVLLWAVGLAGLGLFRRRGKTV